MNHKNGCHNRAPYARYYLPTGALDTPEYRIEHVTTTECQYTHSGLGQADAGCKQCRWRVEPRAPEPQ